MNLGIPSKETTTWMVSLGVIPFLIPRISRTGRKLLLVALEMPEYLGRVLSHAGSAPRYYALNTAGVNLPPLTWLRYSTFLALYPLGVAGAASGP